MLSLQQALEIKESIVSYLQATFAFRKNRVAASFDHFINDEIRGMFKGPYITLKLPFTKVSRTNGTIPLDIIPNWPPYHHQAVAWQRLSTHDRKPEPVILTTGTGSGKTEAFLYPVLDYCYRQHHRPGVKVIIMYPMNALATDQAKRIAEAIYSDNRLRGKVTAGLFIGEGGNNNLSLPRTMGEHHIIEHRNTILDTSPDILLTNFKMLDYALMKHNYHGLWSNNLKDKDLLKFLVLDELHTYDGAQGTDVANLIRRLKLKLHIGQDVICPVGTSATIGEGPESAELLAGYASKVFDEAIDTSAIIPETRVDIEEYFGPNDTLDDEIPNQTLWPELEFKRDTDFESYLDFNIQAWGLEREDLVTGLLKMRLVKDLVHICNSGRGTHTFQDLMRRLSMRNQIFRQIPQWDEIQHFNPKQRIIQSLLAIIAEARNRDDGRTPFLYQQTQLWIREFSGVQYTLEEEPKFSFRDQVESQKEVAALPPWYCRECNEMGWIGVKPENKDMFSNNITDVYKKFGEHHQSVYFLVPGGSLDTEDFQASGYQYTDFLNLRIDPLFLRIKDRNDNGGLSLQAFRKTDGNKTEHICPFCNSRNTIAIIGTKIPTLSSVSVSQTLATDLDPASEKDRKVLAFTNAVQDAAHQAGFIEGRNYRFTFRASLQKIINTMLRPVSLATLGNEFINYWKTHADETGNDNLSAYLYRFYPKDYIGKSTPDDYKNRGVYSTEFLSEFDHRMRWEVFAEFGFNSLIGRTLEKTGSSAAFFDEDKLRAGWAFMKDWLHGNETTETINETNWLVFSNLVLHRLRNRGDVSHLFLEKFRDTNLSLWHLNWQNDSRHFLNPRFGARSRLPKLLTNGNNRNGLLDTTTTSTNNWFHAYFKKSFPLANDITNFINEFYEVWIKSLVEAQIFDSRGTDNQKTHSILPQAILVQKDVQHFQCDVCGQMLYTHDASHLIEDAVCMNYRCPGHYHELPSPAPNYYKAVYNRHRFPRVYARDHTGLLARETREVLENEFKSRNHFNSVNTLVATSTLEMGIDIGDLNTAYNNSVPPLPSNFLQRVGRAGRKSGDALIINFAKSQSHDLYYYTDPLEMMDGDINTPGCYLEVKDILRRHFTAFCFDSWTSDDPESNAIPGRLRNLHLEHANLLEPGFFINKLVAFIRGNKEYLTDSFLSQYHQAVAEQFQEIRDALNDGGFYLQLEDVFANLQKELRHLEGLRKDLDDRQKTLNLAAGDPLYEELNNEKRNLYKIKKGILDRNLLEYLTNIGILPNYAFPETGVVLNGHVLPASVAGSNIQHPPKDFEVVRPASQAIRELAPDNFFYTQGYKFQVTGLNPFDWGDERNSQTMRFCSRCDYIEIDSVNHAAACPKCGDSSWGSASNIHHFVRLTNVKSFNNEQKATLSDSNDDRELFQYQIIDHIKIDKNASEGAWALRDIPFGIEYFKSAEISSVNYGRSEFNDGRNLRINGEQVMQKGFVTCKHCGKSSSNLFQQDYKFHYGYCRYANVRYQNRVDDVFDEVYLFRSFNTEILKVALPIQAFNTEADISMFRAGIELGLRKYFRGNPQHLRIMEYTEYNQRTDKFDRFLILYDTIPGGTGYLKQIFSHQEFTSLLQKSYEAIRDCVCQKEGKDGCYKCIYSYSNQYHRKDLSRERAEKWFESIVRKSRDWVQMTNGLTSLTNSGKIEESELEERFIKLLFDWTSGNRDYKFTQEKAEGIVNYKLNIEKGRLKASYWIRPQRPLGPRDGVQYNTRTDFLISCSRYELDGVSHREKIKKIAVYLDGYQFHASAEHNIFERDLKIRQSINMSQEYKTWTLTWKDMDDFEKLIKGGRRIADDIAVTFNNNFLSNYNMLLEVLRNGEKVNYAEASINVIRLIDQLEYPIIDLYENSWFSYLISHTDSFLNPSFDPASLVQVLKGEAIESNYLLENKIKNLDGLIPVEKLPKFDFIDWSTFSNLKQRQIYNRMDLADASQIEKKDWEVFWSYFNIFQSDYYRTSEQLNSRELSSEDKKSILFDELKEFYSEELHDFLNQCIQKELITADNKDLINSLIDERGNVIAEAELVLSDQKIAIMAFNEESKSVFEERDFKVYIINQIEQIAI